MGRTDVSSRLSRMLSGAVEKASLGAVWGASRVVTHNGAPVRFTPCEATQPKGSNGARISSKVLTRYGGHCASVDEAAARTDITSSAIFRPS